MVSRNIRVMAVVATCVAPASIAHADERLALDESTFLKRVLDQSPRRRVFDDRRRAADSAVAVASVLPNPTLGYEREAVPGLDAADDFLRLGWTIDVNRPRRRDAARAGAEADRAGVAVDAFGLELDARLAYLDAIHARALADQLDRSRASFAAVVDTLRARARQGDASDYEAARATLELDLLDDERADAGRKLELAQLRLGALLGEPRTGYAATDPLSLPARPVATLDPRRPDVDAARARSRHADREAAAARRVFPRLELVGGVMRSTSTSGDGFGYVIGLGGDLPLFDRGGAAGARSRADARRWRSEAEALTVEATGDAERARRELLSRIDQATSYADGPAKLAIDLERRAIVTYREGDRPILELLDVQRTARQVAVRALELMFEARRAELALRRALGGGR